MIKTYLKSIFKDPLLHFILIGVVLFVGADYLSEDSPEQQSNRIVVNRDTLLTYLQYRAKNFDATRFGDMLDNMPPEERQKLIDSYVEEEVLYRQAKLFKLDNNDYTARRRLVQQMTYLTRGFIENGTALSAEEIEDYFKSHADSYYVPAKTTFTHVFVAKDKGEAAAQKILTELNKKAVTFTEAISYGDRFLYNRNYVRKEEDEIASHFGEPMQAAIFALTPDERQWRGPFQSAYGFHLVMVAAQDKGYLPPLDEVRSKVGWDATQARIEEAQAKAVKAIIAGYEIDLDKTLQ